MLASGGGGGKREKKFLPTIFIVKWGSRKNSHNIFFPPCVIKRGVQISQFQYNPAFGRHPLQIFEPSNNRGLGQFAQCTGCYGQFWPFFLLRGGAGVCPPCPDTPSQATE